MYNTHLHEENNDKLLFFPETSELHSECSFSYVKQQIFRIQRQENVIFNYTNVVSSL
jgi:hypothetical protein